MKKMLLLRLLLVLLVHLLLWAAAGEDSSASLALPGCPDRCGAVTIPYPFGITDGCYRKDPYSNQSFLIRCSYFSIPPQPFLGRGNAKVFEVSLEKVVIWNIVAGVCYSESGRISSQYDTWTNLSLSQQYRISDVHNRFIVLGCNIQAVITDEYSAIVKQCRTFCASKESMKNGSCDGVGCCQAPIPKGLKYFYIPIPTMDNNRSNSRSFAPCGYAFLADKDHFNFSVTDFSDPYFVYKEAYAVPIVLDWAVGNETCEEARKKPHFACRGNAACTNSTNGLGYRCSCLPGYDGNPYLPHGCQDVNECENSTKNTCVAGSCINLLGGYNCSCPKGTYGDGKRDGKGCNPLNKEVPVNKRVPEIKIILGVCLGLVLLPVIGFWLYWGLKQKRLMKLREEFFKQNGGLILQQHISLYQGATGANMIFTAEELEKATDSYDQSRIIGKGGYGIVYKGILSDSRVVAIKKAKIVETCQIEQFINEIKILSQINHRNVVKLVGCCLETEVPLLVYEYVSNGTLFHHIHRDGHVSSLSWDNRLRIAAETASALAYLHSAASIPIFHGDVKSANILLDDKYTAKVSDFGASRLVPMDQDQMTTLVQGTMGYLDPEYLLTSQLTEKSDVYSFGVVLVELLTGKIPFSFSRPDGERNLCQCFILSMRENCLWEILDSRVADEGIKEQIVAVSELANMCLQMNGDERPTMKEVAAELEGWRRFENHPWVQKNAEEMESLLGEHVQHAPGSTCNYSSMNCQSTLEIDVPR